MIGRWQELQAKASHQPHGTAQGAAWEPVSVKEQAPYQPEEPQQAQQEAQQPLAEDRGHQYQERECRPGQPLPEG